MVWDGGARQRLPRAHNRPPPPSGPGSWLATEAEFEMGMAVLHEGQPRGGHNQGEGLQSRPRYPQAPGPSPPGALGPAPQASPFLA